MASIVEFLVKLKAERRANLTVWSVAHSGWAQL